MQAKLTLKRVLDLAIAIPACLLLSPFFLAVAVAIKMDSRGPAFFIQERRGLNFKKFRVVKFRTLKHLAPDPHAGYEMLERDPRITRVGSLLRKTSLDELPQLFNVLAGTMSIVGPRPLNEWESQKSLEKFAERFLVKPGITGLSQLSGRNSIDFDARCDKDVEYVRTWTIAQDLLLLFRTPLYLIETETIYPDENSRQPSPINETHEAIDHRSESQLG